MRGEYLLRCHRQSPAQELPPRARRIPVTVPAEHMRRGTTSACAENTASFPYCQTNARNYLRVRGEYMFLSCGDDAVSELPPRARRIHSFAQCCAGPPGTTSACAENTPCAASAGSPKRNYLRVRGEYSVPGGVSVIMQELPPRARRIQNASRGKQDGVGTTSACAENTHRRFSPVDRTRNYLRVRGEYPHSCYASTVFEELPPRARRILGSRRIRCVQLGTTSACAENTVGVTTVVGGCGNYLRVRGEYPK